MDAAPVLIPISAAAARLGIGRSAVYLLMDSGELANIKIGASRRIPVSAIDDYVARRLAEASVA
ncbi:MAG TPA: helix-turn-helix domain-containing protein [Dermatophilaceae bacterium]